MRCRELSDGEEEGRQGDEQRRERGPSVWSATNESSRKRATSAVLPMEASGPEEAAKGIPTDARGAKHDNLGSRRFEGCGHGKRGK